MISFLRGKVDIVTDQTAEIDVGGVGYEVHISPATAARISSEGEEVKLYTYFNLAQDQVALYGFLSRDELSLFKQLITVSGVGPKAGLSLLSVMPADDLRFSIASGDAKAISRAPGVGKRTAERLILELKDKVGTPAFPDGGSGIAGAGADTGAITEEGDAADAVSALTALGYSRTDAVRAVRKAQADGSTGTEALLRAALKYIA